MTENIGLTNACENFRKALNATKNREVTPIVSHKGKTLLSVKREYQSTVKMTVRGF